MKHLKTAIPLRLAVIAGVCLLIVSISAYLGRAWVRSNLVPGYTRAVHMPKIEHAFKQHVIPLQNLVAPFGFTFSKTTADNDGCSAPQYEGIHESMGCSKSQTSNKLVPSKELDNAWIRDAANVEKQILVMGWTKDNPTQPIAGLLEYKDASDTSQHIVTYRINRGGTLCLFSISNSPSSHEVYAVDGCQRSVNYFGGY